MPLEASRQGRQRGGGGGVSLSQNGYPKASDDTTSLLQRELLGGGRLPSYRVSLLPCQSGLLPWHIRGNGVRSMVDENIDPGALGPWDGSLDASMKVRRPTVSSVAYCGTQLCCDLTPC